MKNAFYYLSIPIKLGMKNDVAIFAHDHYLFDNKVSLEEIIHQMNVNINTDLDLLDIGTTNARREEIKFRIKKSEACIETLKLINSSDWDFNKLSKEKRHLSIKVNFEKEKAYTYTETRALDIINENEIVNLNNYSINVIEIRVIELIKVKNNLLNLI